MFQVFVLSILFLVSWTSADPHHEPRHDGEEDDTKVAEQSVIDNSDVDLEENTEVRHHIYMPYPLAYRQSAHPPTIQYVPHYRYVFIGDCSILFSYILQCLVVYSFSKVGYLKSIRIINTFC